MIKLEHKSVIGERLRRQRLLMPIESPEDEQEYLELFNLLQPVAPVHNTRPGDPPKLVHRTLFHDDGFAGKLREQNVIIKGRFCGGRIGYVLQEDLERYAVAFHKPLSKVKLIHEDILTVLKNSGGLSKEQLKQELEGYPASEISKALQALQEAFLVYEHQPDTDWDTGWFNFAAEWFEIKADGFRYAHAVSEVLLSFIKAMVFATAAQIKSWSQLPTQTIRQGIATLVEEGKIETAEITELGQGFVGKEDAAGLFPTNIPQCVFMLDKSDFLVRAHMDALQQRYKGNEVLQFLLIDGEFQGAVLGHWRIGPYHVEDILVDLPSDQAEIRQDEILDAVRKIYSSERHAIIMYNGKPL
jgi:hypothetical protein